MPGDVPPEISVLKQPSAGLGHVRDASLDDESIMAVSDEILDPGNGGRNDRDTTALCFGDDAVTPVGSGGCEEEEAHGSKEFRKAGLLFSCEDDRA